MRLVYLPSGTCVDIEAVAAVVRSDKAGGDVHLRSGQTFRLSSEDAGKLAYWMDVAFNKGGAE